MKRFRVLGPVLLCMALASAGLAGGWFARSQTQSGAAVPPEEASAQEKPVLSDAALKNMDVRWAPAEKRPFSVTREVPALVRDLPSSVRPLVARWGGTVRVVLPQADTTEGVSYTGRVTAAGEIVVELVRAPLPRIDRALTGEIVQAVSESVHEGATDLRSAERSLDLAKQEYERVKTLNQEAPEGLPVIPRQTEINLRYEVLKATAEADRIRARLFLHGLTEAQVETLAAGAPVPPSPDLWKRALERNGLWCPMSDEVLSLLPETLKRHPWTYAGLGELRALGMCDSRMAEILRREKGLAARFHELVALIQQGHALEDIADLNRSGFLEPVVRVRAPAGAPAWLIRHIPVRPGQMVSPGDRIAVLVDPRRVMLELDAPGADAAVVQDALSKGTPLEARPLVQGAGPGLSGITLEAYGRPASQDAPPRVFAVVDNPSRQGGGAGRFWRLQPGLRYMVRLPVRDLGNCFVVPREAIVREGPERLVFLRSGDGFQRQGVRVLFEDHESAVIADGGAIFPGDPVVVSGAFSLSLALRSLEQPGSQSDEHKHGPT